VHLPRIQEILSRSIATAACIANAECASCLDVSEAHPDASSSPAAKESAPPNSDVVRLCKQLQQVQEAAVAVCQLLVTEQNVLDCSGSPAPHNADAQVQAPAPHILSHYDGHNLSFAQPILGGS
jgi:hypothetical protein